MSMYVDSVIERTPTRHSIDLRYASSVLQRVGDDDVSADRHRPKIHPTTSTVSRHTAYDISKIVAFESCQEIHTQVILHSTGNTSPAKCKLNLYTTQQEESAAGDCHDSVLNKRPAKYAHEYSKGLRSVVGGAVSLFRNVFVTV